MCNIIAGPPTHSVGGQSRKGRWCLSSSIVVVCNVAHMQCNSPGVSMRLASHVTSH